MKYVYAALVAASLVACGGSEQAEVGAKETASPAYSSGEFIADPNHPLAELEGTQWCDASNHVFTFASGSAKISGLPAHCDTDKTRYPSNDCGCMRNGDAIVILTGGPNPDPQVPSDLDYSGEQANVPNYSAACYAAGWTITYKSQANAAKYRPSTSIFFVGPYQLHGC